MLNKIKNSVLSLLSKIINKDNSNKQTNDSIAKINLIDKNNKVISVIESNIIPSEGLYVYHNNKTYLVVRVSMDYTKNIADVYVDF